MCVRMCVCICVCVSERESEVIEVSASYLVLACVLDSYMFQI